MVRNVDGTNNSRETITYQVECNVYYKGHVERLKMDMCNLGKIKVILGILWLVAHNPEINQKTREVKITRCLPLCGRRSQIKEKVKKVVTLEEERIVKQAIDDKEDWGKEEEMEEDHRKIEKMVSKRFLKWKKVFGRQSWKGCQLGKFGIILQISKRCSNCRKKGFICYLKWKGKKFRNSWRTS